MRMVPVVRMQAGYFARSAVGMPLHRVELISRTRLNASGPRYKLYWLSFVSYLASDHQYHGKCSREFLSNPIHGCVVSVVERHVVDDNIVDIHNVDEDSEGTGRQTIAIDLVGVVVVSKGGSKD